MLENAAKRRVSCSTSLPYSSPLRAVHSDVRPSMEGSSPFNQDILKSALGGCPGYFADKVSQAVPNDRKGYDLVQRCY